MLREGDGGQLLYDISSSEPDGAPVRTIQGSSLIVPHASFNFSARLDQLAAEDPVMQQQIKTLEQGWLGKLQAAVYQWQSQSHRLTALSSTLLTQCEGLHRKPQVESTALYEKQIAQLTTDTSGGHTPNCYQPASAGSSGKPNNDFEGVSHGQWYISALSVTDTFNQTLQIINPGTAAQQEQVFKPLVLTPHHIAPSLANELNLVDMAVQTPPFVQQSMKLHVDWMPAVSRSAQLNATKRVIGQTKEEMKVADVAADDDPLVDQQLTPVAGWLLANYANNSLQVYDMNGQLQVELRKSASDDRVVQYLDAYLLDEMQGGVPALDPILQAVVDRLSASASLLDAYMAVFSAALDLQSPVSTSRFSSYTANFIGRPLMVARAQWQLLLSEPPLLPQNQDRKTLQPFTLYKDVNKTQYRFPVQLGDGNLANDGLIGYFVVDSSSLSASPTPVKLGNFYSVYAGTIARLSADVNQPCQPDLNVTSLSPQFPLDASTAPSPSLPNESLITVLIFDPTLPIHAQTPVLPLHTVSVPQQYVDNGLRNMVNRTRMGPLLVTQAPEKVDPTVGVAISKPAMGSWKWLQPQPQSLPQPPTTAVASAGLDRAWCKMYEIAGVDSRPKLSVGPYHALHGTMQMTHINSPTE